MEDKDNSLKYLIKNKNSYQLKVGQMLVEMEYSDNNKSFKECMLNILKQKVEM